MKSANILLLASYTFILVIFLGACQDKSNSKKDECDYKDSILISSYAQQLDSINSILSDAEATNNGFFGGTDTVKASILEKIRMMCDKIDKSDAMLKTLQSQLDSSDVKGNLIVKMTYEEKSNELARVKRYYQQLLERVEKIEGENINLKQLVDQHDSEQKKKDLLIAELNRSVADKEDQIKSKTKEINSMEDDIVTIANMSSYKEANMHFKNGEQSLKEFEGMRKGVKGMVTKKGEKEKKLQAAYDSFKKAKEMGHPEAKRQIYTIEYKYSNFLTENTEEIE
jgi:hypothetical protein